MKHKFFLLAVLAITFAACRDYNSIITEAMEETHQEQETEKANTKVDFSYSTSGRTVTFKADCSQKSGGMYYFWEFGDGSEGVNKEVTHTYAADETYNVTLSAMWTFKGNLISKETIKTIKVNGNPTKINITAIEMWHVDVNGELYKAKLVDNKNNVIFETGYMNFMDNDEMPYKYQYNFPYELTNWKNRDYYTLYIYHATKFNSSGTQCLKQQLTKAQVTTFPEYHEIKNNSGNTVVRLYMSYE